MNSLFFIRILLVSLYPLSIINCWIFSGSSDRFVDNSKQLQTSLNGYMVEFGDFNADRSTDLFVLTANGCIDVILMPKDMSKAKRINLFCNGNINISNVAVGDFNGDSRLDVVIYHFDAMSNAFNLMISYGNTDRSNVTLPRAISNKLFFVNQPLHLDWNADMIGDFFGKNKSGNFVVLMGNNTTNFDLVILDNLSSYINNQMEEIIQSLFVDVDEDGQADILLIGRQKKSLVFVVLTRTKDSNSRIQDYFQFSKNKSYDGFFGIGQAVVADFLSNGRLGLLIPVCEQQTSCKSLLHCPFPTLSCDLATFSTNITAQTDYNFVKPDKKLTLATPELGLLSCGDIWIRGHVDCVVVMKDNNAQQSVTLRINNDGNNRYSLLNLDDSRGIMFQNLSQVAIFDLEEDGTPDLLTEHEGDIRLMKHETSDDFYFIKVMILNGLCSDMDNCPGKRLPYGLPLPGISVSYSTDGADGNTKRSIASLRPDSLYTSLQSTYAFFGFGVFSNYINQLTIQLPYLSIDRKYSMSFVVPKTQIVIIPYPLDDPSKWTNKLFLEPLRNRKVIYVAAALLGTMLLVTIILCILQYLEIREDRLEKMQEAQKFHFDAM